MADNYQKRMQRKKVHIDKRIEDASINKGICLLLTGNGKGKSSSALGMVLRALGYQMRVVLVQFIKGKIKTGELLFLAKQENVTLHTMDTGFTWDTQDKTADAKAAQKTWHFAAQALKDNKVDLVVLDELTFMLNYQYLDAETVYRAIKNRPAQQHVVITGRAANAELKALADTVSEVNNLKHAFDSNIKAQPGIDF